mgnify:CR=1 FL=1
MAEEVVLMKGNEAIAHGRILRISYYSPIGSTGNACRTETVGNNRHGSSPGRK